MRTYRRVLAVVALNADAEAVAARAVQLSRFFDATLALATVVDYQSGFECDHAPCLTPRQMREAILEDVREKMERLAAGVGAGNAEIIVACDREAAAVADLTRSWRPDLVLAASSADHGLTAHQAGTTAYDVLMVGAGKPGFAGRLINALTAAF